MPACTLPSHGRDLAGRNDRRQCHWQQRITREPISRGKWGRRRRRRNVTYKPRGSNCNDCVYNFFNPARLSIVNAVDVVDGERNDVCHGHLRPKDNNIQPRLVRKVLQANGFESKRDEMGELGARGVLPLLLLSTETTETKAIRHTGKAKRTRIDLRPRM